LGTPTSLWNYLGMDKDKHQNSIRYPKLGPSIQTLTSRRSTSNGGDCNTTSLTTTAIPTNRKLSVNFTAAITYRKITWVTQRLLSRGNYVQHFDIVYEILLSNLLPNGSPNGLYPLRHIDVTAAVTATITAYGRNGIRNGNRNGRRNGIRNGRRYG
jgi:hypothetical protein